VTRPLRRRLAACLLAALSLGSLGTVTSAIAQAPRAAEDELVDPLSVSIDSMSPSALTGITRKGRVTLRGRVVNVSEENWSDLVAYVVPGTTPMRSEAQLAEAIASDPLIPFGDRLVEEGLYARLPNLAPGQSARYRVTVPVEDLGLEGKAGVYWIGVHILGTGLDGRIEGADGRARTLLPLMKEKSAPAEVSLVLPLRVPVRRGAQGTLLQSQDWRASVAAGGRLSNLLDFAEAATVTLSLLVDPAVVEAVESIGRGNPAFDGKDRTTYQAGIEWLRRFEALARASEVLALPYGDTDAAAALTEKRTDLLATAIAISESELSEYSPVPVLAPLSGFFPATLWEPNGELPRVLLSADSVPLATDSAARLNDAVDLVLADPALSDSEFAPTDSVVGLRQAVLARLAVRSLGGKGNRPIVVALPNLWDPGGATNAPSFFRGLDRSWVRAVDFEAAADLAWQRPVSAEEFVYPDAETALALPVANLLGSDELGKAGATYSELLDDDGTVAGVLVRQGLLTASEHARANADDARTRTSQAVDAVDDRLQKISLTGPRFVTMSSDSGSFQVTITNGLEEPVSVSLVTDTGSPQLRISDSDVLEIPAGQRRSVRLTASAKHIGVYRVTVRATTTAGSPLPDELVLSLRSSRVGQVIWIVFGLAGAILFSAIVLRIYRRVRNRRRG
jgi:hypothetical protein